MKISDVLDRSSVFLNLCSNTKPDLIKEISELVSDIHHSINPQRLAELITEREKVSSTAIDSGVAFPHAVVSGLSDTVVLFARTAEGVDFGSLDSNPTNLLLLIVSPENSTELHIELLARAAKVFRNPDLRSKLMKSRTPEEIYEAIISEDEKY